MPYSRRSQDMMRLSHQEWKESTSKDPSIQKDTLSTYEYEEYVKMKDKLYKQLSKGQSVMTSMSFSNRTIFILSLTLICLLIDFFIAVTFFPEVMVDLTAWILEWKR